MRYSMLCHFLSFCGVCFFSACGESPASVRDTAVHDAAVHDAAVHDASAADASAPQGDLLPATLDGSYPATCAPAAGGGSAATATPVLWREFKDRWHEGWLASPGVVDLDGDGNREVVAARDNRLIVWAANGSVHFFKDVGGRIWTSPVIADISPERPGLEIAAAAREKLYAWDAQGEALAGFPVSFRDEIRSLAVGDIDGDQRLELVTVSSSALSADGQKDIINAFNDDGSVVAGFPPNTTGSSGCDGACYVTGGYDQNVALGDVDGDGKLDILATQDNAYMSLHRGDGWAFDAAEIFDGRTKWPGIRFLHDYALAQQGWADDEQSANQAHFTNSAPAIADMDGDGVAELVVLGSVQNAAQSDRKRGVGLWLLENDGTRVSGWESPFHAPDYLAGLWDFEGTNVVGATNQVSVADIVGTHDGLEMVFAGFDGSIHCVSAAREELWTYRYTTDARVLTGGVALADLSGDGVAEVIFASYSPDHDKSHLFVLDAGGRQQHKLLLPGRGAMAVPTVADVDGNGTLEILVSLKDGEDKEALLQAYTVAGSAPNCLPWPTGRGNLLRNGYIPPTK
ncbi:MAG: VCBS repeat-containing protein [Deltaproteobacteria bacterium]|nr:VCBS repeat-containing protein [Deltaproteobacteria bacterium]